MRTVYRADPTNSLHALFLLSAALELLFGAILYFTKNYSNGFYVFKCPIFISSI